MRIKLERRVQPLQLAVPDGEGPDVWVQRDRDLPQGHAQTLDLQLAVITFAFDQRTKASTK